MPFRSDQAGWFLSSSNGPTCIACAAIARQVAGEFGVPLAATALVALPLAAWLGAAWLSDLRDPIGLSAGFAPPILAAAIATLLVTALASLRHVRQALALQPIETLG